MCQLAASYDAIFLGKAVKANEVSQQDAPGIGHWVMQARLSVIEPFRGLARNTRTVNLEYDLAPEAFRFVQGVTYVVYAYKAKDGRLSVSGCSPTRPIAQAHDDISYFRRSRKTKASCSN